METIDHARTLYEDAAEATNGRAMESLAGELEHRARLIRGERQREDVQETSDAVRDEIAEALDGTQLQERERIADQLEETAKTLKKVFGNANPKAQELSDDAAAEAQLESTEMRVDPKKLAQGEEHIVDEGIATDIRDHELEHNRQSIEADAEEVTIGAETWDTEEVREIAAVSVQKRIDFLSDEYKRFARVKMNSHHRTLVRQGKFRQLEIAMNGAEALAA